MGDPAEVARAVAGHDVLVVHGAAVSAEVLGAAPLRLVCCARGGPVNVDVAAATDRGIPVVNTPGKNAEAVAELTIAFALLLIRAVPRASRYLLDGGGFAESVFEGREFFGAEAPSLTMGLVGLGHVGREVARRARALGFAVLGYDPQPPALRDEGDVELVSLDTLLARSDIVSLHARLTPQNRRMFSRDRFAQMRPGAYFINTARESLVDERALRQALEQGRLGGAALDVLERTRRRPASAADDAERLRHPAHRRGHRRDPGPGRAAGGHRGGRAAGRAGARQRGEPRRPCKPRSTWERGGMSGPYLLAIDAGTGSCRAVLFTETGEQAGVGQREWTHHEPPGVPGGQDFDVAAGWQAIAACVRDALRSADNGAGAAGADVAAVAATSMREGMVLYDAGGREIFACPNVDSRAFAEAEDLIREGAAEKIYAEAGDWVSITSPARLRWLARHRPDILAATASLGMLSDWIVYRLTGEHVTEPSCGSSSGMFSLASRRWSQTIPALSGLPAEVLPPVVDPGTVVGEVSAAAAELTGLRPGTPVAAGGGDTQLGLLGAGAQRDEYTVVAGTFWQNTVLLAEPLIDPRIRLRTLCHVVPGEWMLEGIGFYCGMSMRWFRDAFCDAEVALARARGVDPYVVMEEIAAAVPAGSGGVIAILSNLMNAKRWAHASPSFLQFDLGDPAASGRGACVRAIEEAAAYVARGHRDIITELTGLTFGEVVFTGGAGRGRLWPQIMADVLGVPVHIPAVTESSALGAAICAGAGAGLYSDLLELRPGLRRRTATFEPDQAAAAAYDEQYAAWREIYRRMLDITDDGLLHPLWRAAGA